MNDPGYGGASGGYLACAGRSLACLCVNAGDLGGRGTVEAELFLASLKFWAKLCDQLRVFYGLCAGLIGLALPLCDVRVVFGKPGLGMTIHVFIVGQFLFCLHAFGKGGLIALILGWIDQSAQGPRRADLFLRFKFVGSDGYGQFLEPVLLIGAPSSLRNRFRAAEFIDVFPCPLFKAWLHSFGFGERGVLGVVDLLCGIRFGAAAGLLKAVADRVSLCVGCGLGKGEPFLSIE